ncbi:glutamine amidotransferase [Flavobacteriaceae bacterium GF1]
MRPEDETTKSEFEAFLRFGELAPHEVYRIRLEKEPIPEIDIRDYSAIIAGGSPFDVSIPEEKKSPVQKRIERFFIELFDEVVPVDFPFLGACSGNGHLGKYCGATISNKYAEALGLVEVTKTNAGRKDPLLRNLPQTFSAFVGHKEACDQTPPRAELLLTSKSCPVQMFRIKKNIYATQFHPEADANEFILRIKVYKYFGYFPPGQAEELINAIRDSEAPVANEILRRFVKRYKS